jgi:hypothetical protein
VSENPLFLAAHANLTRKNEFDDFSKGDLHKGITSFQHTGMVRSLLCLPVLEQL